MRFVLLLIFFFSFQLIYSQSDTAFYYKYFPVINRADADNYKILEYKSADSLEVLVTSFYMDRSINSREYYLDYPFGKHGKAMYWNKSKQLKKIMSYWQDTLHGESQIMDSLGRIDVKMVYNKGEFYYWEKRQNNGTYKKHLEPYISMPIFPGCETLTNEQDRSECSTIAVYTSIQENIKYPAVSKDNGISGTVFIGYLINKEGYIKETSVLKVIDGDEHLVKEALNVILSFPKFTPGKEGGEPAEMMFSIPVKFSLR